MTKMHVITKITNHVKHEVLKPYKNIAVACVLARPVLAKLCSTAFSVESRICNRIAPEFYGQKVEKKFETEV